MERNSKYSRDSKYLLILLILIYSSNADEFTTYKNKLDIIKYFSRLLKVKAKYKL